MMHDHDTQGAVWMGHPRRDGGSEGSSGGLVLAGSARTLIMPQAGLAAWVHEPLSSAAVA